jgi:hypothetical protein
MRKDKIFELKIEDDDELSGIDSISLVDEPAIEVNWMFFNKEKPHEFHIPDGEDSIYLEKLMGLSQDEQELFDEGFVVSKVTIMGEQGFYSTNPNAPSIEDEKEYNVRYKYILNPRISQSPVIKTTRDFCRTLINQNRVWRIEDMESTRNDFGDSAMVWRGGFNCRHVWARIEYKKDVTIVNKASVNKGKVSVGGFPSGLVPDVRVLGLSEPSTVTSATRANPSPSTVRNLGLRTEKFQEGCPIATEDVATNLKNRQRAIDEAHYGPLNPNEPNEEYWKKKADMFGGDIQSAKKALCGNCAFFVKTPSMLDCIAKGINDTNEWDTINAGDLGYCEAFDFKCAGARTCDAWVVGGPITEEDMGYDVGSLPSYVDEVSGETISKSIAFESYNDYPESAKNNACKVLRWRDEHGDEVKGMTQVGWTRANQLCKGENISEETIARMASFARHRENAEVATEYKSTPWKDKGYVAWLGWGGTTGIEWASNKLESIRNNMSKQYFQADDEKRIVLGPAMIPDQKIFRKDNMGNPYYVFFSPETIKMIAEKYMRNKYTDNNDQMHDGKAVKDVYVVESWIKEDENDKSTKYGYGDLPVGTWFVSMKVKNDDTWNKVKSGVLNGFSVSGFFEEVSAFTKEEMFLYKVAEVLKKYKD